MKPKKLTERNDKDKIKLIKFIIHYKYNIIFWILFTIYFQVLGGHSNDAYLPIEEMEYEYFHKYFEMLIPKAEALIPVNPSKLPGHVGGSILSQDLDMSTDMITKPLQNLRVAANYVRDGHNATHTAKRVAEVAIDTGKINLIIAGPALSGQMANACADKYTKRIVSDYKLVDSVKQKCIRSKWAKRFGKDFVAANRRVLKD